MLTADGRGSRPPARSSAVWREQRLDSTMSMVTPGGPARAPLAHACPRRSRPRCRRAHAALFLQAVAHQYARRVRPWVQPAFTDGYHGMRGGASLSAPDIWRRARRWRRARACSARADAGIVSIDSSVLERARPADSAAERRLDLTHAIEQHLHVVPGRAAPALEQTAPPRRARRWLLTRARGIRSFERDARGVQALR